MVPAPPDLLPSFAALQPGAMVTPAIRLTRLLGRGGMGSVWLAEHLRLRTEVVVKFVAPEHAENENARRRFEREATLAAQAKSPHVVHVFDHGISTLGLPYIAMERLVGEDLGARIQREKRIEARTLAAWLRQVCSGLGRAHQRGIVHRDIKPENVFLCDEEGEVLIKLLDFGIAKGGSNVVDLSGTRTGDVMGTAYYMSPEQTLGTRDIDWRADLWALGVLTYYALTGVRPFDGDAIAVVVLAINQNTPPPPSSVNPALPGAIDAFMVKALARSPAARFQSAKEFAEAFAVAAESPPHDVDADLSAAPLPLVRAAAAVAATDTALAPGVSEPRAAHGALGTTTNAALPQTASRERRGRRGALLAVVAVGVVGAVGASGSYLSFAHRAPRSIASSGRALVTVAPSSYAPLPAATPTASPPAIPEVLPVAVAPVVASAQKLRVSKPPKSSADEGDRAKARAPTAAAMPAVPGATSASIKTNPLHMKLE